MNNSNVLTVIACLKGNVPLKVSHNFYAGLSMFINSQNDQLYTVVISEVCSDSILLSKLLHIFQFCFSFFHNWKKNTSYLKQSNTLSEFMKLHSPITDIQLLLYYPSQTESCVGPWVFGPGNSQINLIR